MKHTYKSVSPIDSKSFKVIRQDNKQEFDFPWHYHPEFELTYISNNQGIRYVGNNVENFYENDLVLLGSNLPHCWINTSDQEEPSRAVVIYLNEDLVKWLSDEQFSSISALFEKSNQGIRFNAAVALKVKSRLYELLNVAPFERFIILLQILKELSDTNEFHLLSQTGFTYELSLTNNERINSVYQYVRKNYQKKISLSDVATHVNMSEEYFSRFFSKSLMKSFFTFLNEYRINRACKLLIETDKQVSEICYGTGFESIPFFYRQFKKIKKCPPQAYRQKFHHAGE
jgi:AraC-like DNA-binding protein/quercetin dioxygenase-like cupin family protein